MAARKKTDRPAISPERLEEIRASAHSGANWASLVDYGPACVCGAGERTYMAGIAFRGEHGVPTRDCSRHQGGTVERKPEGTTYPGENGR